MKDECHLTIEIDEKIKKKSTERRLSVEREFSATKLCHVQIVELNG